MHDAENLSLAEAVGKFQSSTPTRFKSMSKAEHSRGPAAQMKHDALKLTHPDSPKFATSSRARRTTVKSTAELEDEEMARFQAAPFKANPVNKAILEAAGTTGVKTIDKRPLTVPEEPHFRVNDRVRPQSTIQEESPPKRSKPNPTGAPTVPVSPVFATDLRGRSRYEPQEPSNESSSFKAKPAPSFKAAVFKPAASTQSLTELVPFKLAGDALHEKAQRELEAKRQQEEQQEFDQHSSFKAQPIREYHTAPSRTYEAAKLTEVKPFSLASDARHEENERRLLVERQREEDETRERSLFKATEPTVLDKSPFMVRKSSKPLTEISNFDLESDRRAEKRELFDKQIRAKLEDMEHAKKEQEMQQLEEDKRQINQLRAAAAFKANPIKYSTSGMHVAPSTTPLTTPMSPALMTKSRANIAK